MKNLTLFCLFLACIGLESCNKKENQKEADVAALPEKSINLQCYQALYDNDTLNLTINTSSTGKISGEMVMKVFEKAEKVGKITGEFRGDTLFADYSFTQVENDKVMYKNPIALLKRDQELILGNGQIETYLGASYFAKGKPIDFDNVKYKFSPVDCVDK